MGLKGLVVGRGVWGGLGCGGGGCCEVGYGWVGGG